MDVDGFLLDDKRQKAAENDIPDIIQRWRKQVIGHSDTALAGEESEKQMKRAAEPKVKYRTDKSDSSVVPQKAGLPQNDRRAKCFLIPVDETRSNKYDLSISRYKEIEHKEIEYEKPDVIMQKVSQFEKKIASDIEEINWKTITVRILLYWILSSGYSRICSVSAAVVNCSSKAI